MFKGRHIAVFKKSYESGDWFVVADIVGASPLTLDAYQSEEKADDVAERLEKKMDARQRQTEMF